MNHTRKVGHIMESQCSVKQIFEVIPVQASNLFMVSSMFPAREVVPFWVPQQIDFQDVVIKLPNKPAAYGIHCVLRTIPVVLVAIPIHDVDANKITNRANDVAF